MNNYAIETTDIKRNFKSGVGKKAKEINALDGINLGIRPGELFGLLGPNGAGKTTLIKILTTLLGPSKGNATIWGHDIIKGAKAIRPLINMVSGGENSGYGLLTVRENLWMFAQFYGLDYKITRQRTDRLLSAVGLMDKANTRCSELSTGMRQKMNIARGFITDPLILFLDEPTLGLDVESSREVRGYIQDWLKEDGKRTVFLTTHYLEEADRLCDRIGIISQGKIIACDSPESLRSHLKDERTFQFTIAPKKGLSGPPILDFLDNFPEISSYACPEKNDNGHFVFSISLKRVESLPRIINTIDNEGFAIQGIDTRPPTLEEIFIKIVQEHKKGCN